MLYQWASSRDYDPSRGLERIQAVRRAHPGQGLLAINSADDERNPPELGVLEREVKRVRNGRVLLIPASEQTAGHATAFYGEILEEGSRGSAANRAALPEIASRCASPTIAPHRERDTSPGALPYSVWSARAGP